ncbi:MAG: nucleotidyl transferase AbiEii/AbiGii toxin family protein [Verrucomicrobia bacterium]|nr:nucleotidyl transferase AbiEii/AbiGii toxin family protein [Verrucomicrobiota bacterium]
MNDIIRRMLQPYNTATNAEAERAAREILQEIALIGLWRGKFFEHAAFYGGTALRILYGLDRFSEDLDFTLLQNNPTFEWALFERNVVEELMSFGFEVSFLEKKKQFESEVRSAFLKTNTHHALLQIGIKDLVKTGIHPETTIRIKVEIDTHPVLGFEVEPVYLREPLPVPIRAVRETSLFAGKLHAALYRAWKMRVKGRDWYDVIWFLRRGVPLNVHYLETCMRSGKELQADESLTKEKVIELLCRRVEAIDLTAAKEDVAPFLKDSSVLDLWSIDFFKHWFHTLKLEQ